MWLGALVCAVWAGLLATGFWTCAQRSDRVRMVAPDVWPDVVAVVPARNEGDVIARSLASLIAQDYPGDFRIIMVDDNSEDDTAAIAGSLGSARLAVLRGAPLAAGWTGKLWAVHQGIAAAGSPAYLWLSDADIEHAPDTLRKLVGIACAPGPQTEGPETEGPDTQGRHLVSFMAKLSCATWAERALVPAFIWFFMMLYPFNWINRQGGLAKYVAGAAGGCMLVRASSLARAGGIGAMRGALIDDCTLGKLIKQQGPIWLGLTQTSRSIRPYAGAGEIFAMIARSAYAQLRYNPALLVATVAGLALVFGGPWLAALAGVGLAKGLGLAACAMMLFAYQPILGFYARAPLWALGLPLVAAFYTGATLWSAISYYRGAGGMWKGRAQAGV